MSIVLRGRNIVERSPNPAQAGIECLPIAGSVAGVLPQPSLRLVKARGKSRLPAMGLGQVLRVDREVDAQHVPLAAAQVRELLQGPLIQFANLKRHRTILASRVASPIRVVPTSGRGFSPDEPAPAAPGSDTCRR